MLLVALPEFRDLLRPVCSLLWIISLDTSLEGSFLTRGRAPFLDSSVHFYCLTVTVCHCVIAGYETHLVGKWHLGFHKWPYVPTRRGFKSSYGYWDGAEDHFSHKVSGVLDFHDQEEPVRNLDGTYATYAFVEVNRTSQ